jgi:hypothetical protein
MNRQYFRAFEKDPSPTPPHKGEGLARDEFRFRTMAATCGGTDVIAPRLQRFSPSPLWGGVGEGTFFLKLENWLEKDASHV